MAVGEPDILEFILVSGAAIIYLRRDWKERKYEVYADAQ